jgi:hypothetical protein
MQQSAGERKHKTFSQTSTRGSFAREASRVEREFSLLARRTPYLSQCQALKSSEEFSRLSAIDKTQKSAEKYLSL